MDLGVLFVALAAASWGTLGVIASGLNDAGFSGFEVAALRVLFAAVALLVAAPLVLRPHIRAMLRQWRLLIAHSLIGVLVYNVTYFLAIGEMGVTFSVGLLYTAPVWTLLFAAVLLGERPTPLRAMLASGACAGVALTLGIGGGGPVPAATGIALGLASGASYALYPVIGKKAVKRVHPTALLFSSFIVSGLAFLALPPTWSGLARLGATGGVTAWAALLAMSLFGTIFSYFLFTRGLRTVPASAVAVITTMEPLVAITLAATILGEALSPLQYLGIGLIIASSVLSSRLGARTARQAKPPAPAASEATTGG